MREGPLAALFRKTEGEEPTDAETDVSQTPAAKDERGAPHPALGATAERSAAEEGSSGSSGTSVRAPKDRLKQAFSSEIPASLMDREGAATAAGADDTIATRSARPVMDDYERSEHPSFADGPTGQPRIRVVGVGGAGVNAVNRMVEAEVEGVEFLAVNTDLQSLQQSTADITLHIGAEITRGLGSGSDANVGRQAAMEDYDRVKSLLKGSDMIFITAGAGGGTGTGAAPIVARIAREVGALTVAIVTKPFGFEGSRRSEQAEQGIDALAEEVDTLIVVPNNRLLSVLDKQTAMVEAFRVADDVLRQGVQGISDLVTLPGSDQSRLRRRAHDHVRRRHRAAGDRDGRWWRSARGGRRAAGRRLAVAGNLDGRRALDPAVDHGRARPVAVGGQRGRQGGVRGGAPRREHHLRRDGRREARRPGVGHGRRDRLRRRQASDRARRLGRAARARG